MIHQVREENSKTIFGRIDSDEKLRNELKRHLKAMDKDVFDKFKEQLITFD